VLSKPNGAIADTIRFGDFTIVTDAKLFKRTPGMDTVFSYWCDKGGFDRTIARKDINPADIRHYINHLVIADFSHDTESQISSPDSSDTAIYDFAIQVRLMGTYVVEFYGENTGNDIDGLVNRHAINRIYCCANEMLRMNAPLLSIAQAYDQERVHMDALSLYMPLYGPNSTHPSGIEKVLVYVEMTEAG